MKIYFSFIIDFDRCLEANPDDEDLNKTIEEELVIDDVGAEAIAKGQLNSEWFYEVIVSPKMPTKYY